MTLPPTLFDLAAHNEDAAVELLLLDALAASTSHPLRILTVAGCGTHAITMCSSPRVTRVDAVDIAPTQLKLGALLAAAMEASTTPEAMAMFIGNMGSPASRTQHYQSVREHLNHGLAVFWDRHLSTVAAGVLRCGGTERMFAHVRAHLPTRDLVALSKEPEGILAAFKAGFTVEALEANTLNLSKAAMARMVEHGPPMMSRLLSTRLAECATDAPDLMVSLIVDGAFPMAPVASRPQFLQPHVFDAIRRHGCGPSRLHWHEGPIQEVGPTLAWELGPFDLVDMSNVLSPGSPEAPSIVTNMRRALRPGGLILGRTTRPPGALATMFAECGLAVDVGLSTRALEAESSFFHTDVCVAVEPR